MRLALIALVTMSAYASAETLFTVPWGKEAGQLGYYNPSTPPFEQPYGEGPGGIAAGPSGEIWISDQFNDRILRFDRKGTVLGAVGKVGEVRLARPRALWIDPGKSVAVVSSQDMKVLWLDQATHKLDVLEKADGKSFPQIEAVQGGPHGELYVGDFMWSALFRFERGGAAPVRSPWGLSGLATDKDGRVYSIEHREQAGKRPEDYLVSKGASGAARDHFPLIAPELQSPYLVGLDPQGNAVIRFIKTLPKVKGVADANPNRFLIVRYDPTGKEGKPLGETQVSVVTQQFAITPEGSVLGLSFDAMAAPQGGVDVVEFK